jgi:hypothetical protein
MSSADSSSRTYLGSLEAGKIASNEIAATMRNDARNARSLASSLIATAFATRPAARSHEVAGVGENVAAYGDATGPPRGHRRPVVPDHQCDAESPRSAS